MKRIFAGMVMMSLVFSVGGTTAFAAEPGIGRYYVDEDGDGICDNADSMCIYADLDGDGICDNYAAGQGRGNGLQGVGGRNYVDTDGDGICDNYASGQCRGGGCGFGGRGNGFRGGRGR